MIFYGWGRKSVPLVGVGNTSCSKCCEVRPFRLFLSYNYMHLYWIFGAVLRRRYLVACSVCSQGFLVDKKDALQAVPNATPNPIPFMQRWGLAVFAAGIAVAIAISSHAH
jgi:hypothetical protein